MGTETTGTARAHTRPACPGCGCAVEARHLAARVGLAPLSPTDVCHRRTSGGQGITPKTHDSPHPPREFGKTRRSRRCDGGCQRLASCICPTRAEVTVYAIGAKIR